MKLLPIGNALVLLSLFGHVSAYQRISMVSTRWESQDRPTLRRAPATLLNNPHSRRTMLLSAGLLGGIFGGGDNNSGPSAVSAAGAAAYKSKGPTNEVVKVVNGMKR